MARRVWGQKIGAVEQRPTIEGDRLYVPVADGRLVALDLESGALQWERQLGASPTEPLALADRVYLGAGRKLLLPPDAQRCDRLAVGNHRRPDRRCARS